MSSDLDRELAAFKFLDRLNVQLSHVREPHKALRQVLRDTHEFFQADHACIATLEAGNNEADMLFRLPKSATWDVSVLTRFIRHQHPEVQQDMLIAPLHRRKAAWGAMALVRPGRPYDRKDWRLLGRATSVLSDAIHRIDNDRLSGVRDRIDKKIMEQIDPKDLFYQILDGLRSLTQYDHSSALLIREEGDSALVLVAEQIAWMKAKSQRIGLRIPIPSGADAMLHSGQIFGFDRVDESWQEWKGRPAIALAQLLDYNVDHAEQGQRLREGSMLCAPLITRDGLVGVLKIAGRFPTRLMPYDAELVEHFRSQAAVAIQNLHRTASLRARVLVAERKHAMAELARSVSHDVNNALGSMLPLVQQMQEDLRAAALTPDVLRDDLEQVQKSLQVCRRIFSGMLAFSRGAARRSPSGHVRLAFETASAILKYGMGRRGIALTAEIPDGLPAVACGQSDLEQVFLNLLTNAREATPQGGTITVAVSPVDATLRISIVDTGKGIPPQDLPKVLEPFFTTKPHGSGLGLSICRSILWENGGTLLVDSKRGNGTRVDFTIPRAAQAASIPSP